MQLIQKMEQKSLFSNLIEHLKEYLSNKMRILLLKSSQKSFYILSSIISNSILALFFTLFLIFTSISLAFFIGEYFDHLYLGFLSVAVLYILIFFILFNNRKKWLEEKITNLLIKKFFMEEEDEQ